MLEASCRVALAAWLAVSGTIPLLPCGCWSTTDPTVIRSDEDCDCCTRASRAGDGDGSLASHGATGLVCWGEDPRGHWSQPGSDDDSDAATAPPALSIQAGGLVPDALFTRREPPTPPPRGPTLEELSVYRI